MTIELRVLKDGTILRDDEGNVLDASSSVVLLMTGEANLLVDTAMPRDAHTILAALASEGLGPADIDLVVNTHNHMDHTGCNRLFGSARFAIHRIEGAPLHGGDRVVWVEGDGQLVPGVEVVETPGHTRGHVSVIAGASGRTWAVAGDALPTVDNFEKWVPPRIHYDPEVALRSMRRLVERVGAGAVVPGHGPPFEVGGRRPWETGPPV